MYPGVIVEYDDQSTINTLPISEVRVMPLFCTVFTSDKGTEEWTRISGKDFFNMYGENISFARHGQPLLQAAMTINAGGELICKRLVADDAKLANIGIVATITESSEQVTDAAGNLLYKDADGNETTKSQSDDGLTQFDPIMKNVGTVKYVIKSATDAKTPEEAKSSIEDSLGENEYLLYVITDNGRGTSNKRVRFTPNYRLSKSLSYTMYTMQVLENSVETESIRFTVNPSIIVKDQNISLMSMIRANSTQLRCIESTTGIDGFVAKLAEYAGVDKATMYKYDVLFGCTNKGAALSGIKIDNNLGSIDLQYSFGQQLQNGDNGSFGNAPIENAASEPAEPETEYEKQAIAALNGTFDHVIFNLDQYKIDAFVDANYSYKIKRAIETLATFREDFMYFRDQGLGVVSLTQMDEMCDNEAQNMFCATYCQSYDVIDPYTKRQITVTIGYSLAQLLVQHCNNGRILPTAGMKHKMVINDAIYGTLSFSPTICPEPEGNQKEKMEEMRINYASYIDNQLVIETLYTSQEAYTQWSYVSNVMGIQEVVKAIRTKCPAIRYSFIDGEDLDQYKADVEDIIAPYRSNFKNLELEYIADATYAANKIFYAVLKVVYKNFVQTEWFKVTALNAIEVEE